MGPRYISTTFLNEQEDTEYSPENSGDSPKSTRISSSSSSPKKSKRSIQKRRVISVPIKDVRIKGEMGAAPPSDCWAWRKYGQKPIKGSPYPRGYYRCSSSKGCPARKQVERSNVDTKLLIITYSCEHNHTYPQTKNNKIVSATIYQEVVVEEEEDDEKPIKIQPTKSSSDEAYSEIDNSNDKLGNFGGDESLIGGINDYYGLWFSDHFECTSSNSLLEAPIFTAEEEERVITDSDMAMAFTNVREEDESFFADLGELPEFSTVFRGGRMMKREEEEHHRRHSLTPWCGTTT